MSTLVFRTIFLGGLLFGALSSVVDTLFPGLLSPSLSQAWDQEPNFFDQASSWLIALVTIWAVAMLVGAIGFTLLKRWGRTTLLWGSVVGIALYPPLGSSASSWLSSALGDTSSLMFGAALAISYFSPLSAHFSSAGEA